MNYFIEGFGILMILAGIALLLHPEPYFRLLGQYSASLVTHLLVIVVRLVFGAALVAYAAQSKFPVALEILGWIAFVAALILMMIGRQRFIALINWAARTAPRYHRLSGAIAIVFGGFICYAVA